ncbi:MAG: sigma-54-dependent Fis family transcriptional regulator [Bdellovibrionales bacterium]|nr:sigma-54-dependent Fis family transcriptional regulator [Bdellovibrionales bacterium]
MGQDFQMIHTLDPKMRHLLTVAENIASSRATVLITGESGTGKELMARYIHSRSHRSGRRLVALNCAAVPEGLLESELFGYEKGAFTGAEQRKPGKFELAHESTFLLDEISELPLLLQAKLLRVIQEGEVERLGSQQPVKVNTRLIATTNRSLEEMVKEGSFREDLYYRLNVIPLEIPSLRSRPKDIELLARMFVEMSCGSNGVALKHLADEAIERLKAWRWPGNVRELQNVVERTILLTPGTQINRQDVQLKEDESKSESEINAGMTVSQAERLLILKTLDFTGQNRTKAAHMLGISIRTLRNKINEYKEEKRV